MKQTTIIHAWNSMILIVALCPLGIFWAGRGLYLAIPTGETHTSLLFHSVVSAIYLLAVVATSVWVRRTGLPGVIAALVAIAASIGASIGFSEIGTAEPSEVWTLGAIPVLVAVWMLVLFAAGNAAWVGLYSLVLAIRGHRPRSGRRPRETGPSGTDLPN